MGKAKRARQRKKRQREARKRKGLRTIARREAREAEQALEEEKRQIDQQKAVLKPLAEDAARVGRRKMRDAEIARMTPEEYADMLEFRRVMGVRRACDLTVKWHYFPITKTILPTYYPRW